jgi:hypothetical protein
MIPGAIMFVPRDAPLMALVLRPVDHPVHHGDLDLPDHHQP